MSTELEIKPVDGAEAGAQIRRLRNLLHCIAIAVLILTGTFFVFIYRQVVIVRKSTAEMGRFIQQYEQANYPDMLERVRQRLDAYRQQDPAFAPIYARYFGSIAAPSQSLGTPAKAAPASTNPAPSAPR